MNATAKAIKAPQYKSRKQWLSGFHEGYDRTEVWKVELLIGTSVFVSSRPYATREGAQRAATKIQNRLNSSN